MTKPELTILSPLEGTVASLESVPDPIFATGTVGAGVAVVPDPGVEVVEITAPMDGTLTRVQPHFFVLDNGEKQLLVQLGVDTARLEGQGFDTHWPESTDVHQGMPIVTYTPRELGRMGFDPIVIIVMMKTSTHDLKKLAYPGEPINRGGKLFSC
ncbi:PTS sugar transporter subunit IIA [Corynebacterium anserum]|uniref:PTS glucose transporter subunit IIA n=1 Tax=Corynebacterium anserum TaxID=2684406 RepID=A0A7G7YLU2_9CORY|nr:PTS glucose transporter subunit IIA [Corynebacterium anserum]MBC2681372.1 PTS glucose transporter subunit IIA [Corynebacterium anserum]QNH95462.1 PTS glucose transporter subunit IIA [Corynebacterium anserum]